MSAAKDLQILEQNLSAQEDVQAVYVRLGQLIYRGHNTEIYSAKSLDDKPLIIKRFLPSLPKPDDKISRLRHEYAIIRSIKSTKVRQALGFGAVEGQISLILEDIGGESLRSYLGKFPPLLARVNVAESWARALASVHCEAVVHGDVTPDNILVKPSGEVILIDFGLARSLNEGSETAAKDELNEPEKRDTPLLDGTLPFIAPEQTGRTKLVGDERADLYSLGVCLYQLFTGSLPFEGLTPMEFIHAHLAVNPEPILNRNSKLPPCLATLVMKLLEKNPDNRFRGALGIAKDLAQIGKFLASNDQASLAKFKVGQQDFPLRLRRNQHFYGGQDLLQVLQTAWQRVQAGSGSFLVLQGPSGSGKTSLINQLTTNVWNSRSYMAWGKFEEAKRNVAYSAAIQIVHRLVQLVRRDSAETFDAWQKALEKQLSTTDPLLSELIPEITSLLPNVQVPLDADPIKARNRLHLAFFRFFASFKDLGKPLLLIFDDIQWADTASLELLSELGKDQEGRWLLIGAYQNNHLGAQAIIGAFLTDWKQSTPSFNLLNVLPLSQAETELWCCEILTGQHDLACQLAAILHQRSQGNPLFIDQFIQTLYRSGKIKVSLDAECWLADLPAIRLLPLSDHVIELLVEKLSNLPQTTQMILACAAHLGSEFAESTLAKCLNMPLQTVRKALASAEKHDMVCSLNIEYPYGAEEHRDEVEHYRFLHDRIIEACRMALDAKSTELLRLKIGRYLVSEKSQNRAEKSQKSVENHSSAASWSQVVQGIEHCSAAQSLINSAQERVHLATLACLAGENAQTTSAWEAGLRIFRQGLEFLKLDQEPSRLNAREGARVLRRRLQMGGGTCAVLSGQSSEAQSIFEKLLIDSATPLEAATVQSLRCQLFISTQKYSEAVNAGLLGLKALKAWRGPVKVSVLAAGATVVKCLLRVSRHSRADLLSRPTVTDRQTLLIIKLLNDLVHPSLMIEPTLGAIIVCKQVDYFLTHGHSPYSIFPLLYLVIVMTGTCVLSGLKLWRKDTPQLLLTTYFDLERHAPINAGKLTREMAYRSFALIWSSNFRTEISSLAALAPRLIELGDKNLGAGAVLYGFDHLWLTGHPIAKLKIAIENWTAYADQNFHLNARKSIVRINQSLTLLSERDPAKALAAASALTTDVLDHRDGAGYVNAMLAVQGYLMTLLGQHETGFRFLMKSWRTGLVRSHAGNYHVLMMFFFLAIANAFSYQRTPLWKRPWRLLIMVAVRRILSVYTLINPTIARHKLLFAKGLGQTMGRKPSPKALALFERAVELARSGEFFLDEGCMAENVGRLLLTHGSHLQAEGFLRTALSAYEKCEMLAKVNEIKVLIENHFPTTFEARSLGPGHHGSQDVPAGKIHEGLTLNQSSTSENIGPMELDLPTLTRAAYALSREIEIDALKTTMLQLLVENAGARYAALLWRTQDKSSERGPLEVVAYRTPDGQCDVTPQLPHDGLISSRVLQYLATNQEFLLIDDVANEPEWASDMTMGLRHAKSVMCLPIVVRGAQNGAIYLENDLLPYAFSEERLSILRVLAGQLAISLDHATLYLQLKEALASERKARLEEQATYQAYVAAEAQRIHLQTGIEAAEAVQKSLIKVHQNGAQYQLAYLYDPAENTGGDWLSTYQDELGQWLFLCLGDVTGHGIQAALVTAAVAGAAASTTLRLGPRTHTLEGAATLIMTSMNSAVASMTGTTSHLMTMVIVGIEIATGKVCYLNAAHEPMLWLGKKVTTVIQSGNHLGSSSEIEIGKWDFRLEPGDSLLLHSDGLLLNPDTKGNKLKMSWLRRLVAEERDPQRIIDSLSTSAANFAKSTSRDDAACLVFRWSKEKVI